MQIPILQAIESVKVPVIVEPVTLNSGGDFGFVMFAVILAVVAAAVIAFLAHSKASALSMYRERDQERRQDDQIRQLKERQDDREHWLQHQIEARASRSNG